MEEAASASATVLDIKAPVFAAHKPVTSDITLRPAGSFRQRGFEVYVTTTEGRGCRQRRRLPRGMWEIMGVSPVHSACTSLARRLYDEYPALIASSSFCYCLSSLYS